MTKKDKQTQELIKELVQFTIGQFPTCGSCGQPAHYWSYKDYPKKCVLEDGNVPFFSEAYLYNLLGKDDARTLLAHIERLCEHFGIDLRELQKDESDN